jgi:hypothetical protein
MVVGAEGCAVTIGTGMPATLKLEEFGRLVRIAFPGCDVYLVGTAAMSKEWRDVDVRCLLTNAQYRRYVGEPGQRLTLIEPDADRPSYFSEEAHSSAWPTGKRRTSLTLAFAELAKTMTGLPVDFQFQTFQHANACYSRKLHGTIRVPLGLE